MKPILKTSEKGNILIHDETLNFDFYINADGEIERRGLRFSKESDFSLQVVSLIEAGQIYDPNINEMIIGCDESDKLQLSKEAFDFFEEKQCKIKLLPLGEAVIYWNRYEGHAFGLFHIPKHNN